VPPTRRPAYRPLGRPLHRHASRRTGEVGVTQERKQVQEPHAPFPLRSCRCWGIRIHHCVTTCVGTTRWTDLRQLGHQSVGKKRHHCNLPSICFWSERGKSEAANSCANMRPNRHGQPSQPPLPFELIPALVFRLGSRCWLRATACSRGFEPRRSPQLGFYLLFLPVPATATWLNGRRPTMSFQVARTIPLHTATHGRTVG